jgi:hypothetical protein
MKTTHNGKRYDSRRCETLAESDHYNNGNYAGTTSVERASDGTLLLLTETNGQDLYLTDDFDVPTEPICWDDYDLTDEQEARCVELGYIVKVM